MLTIFATTLLRTFNLLVTYFLSSLPIVLPPYRQLFHSGKFYSYLRRIPSKSCGPDGVPFWVSRDFAAFLAPAITYSFNRSLSKGFVSKCFEHDLWTSVDVSDFRPIMLFSVLSMVLEKMVVKKFILPLVKDIVDSLQFAYIPRLGSITTCALVLLAYQKIIEFLDSRSGAVRLLSVNFSKFFFINFYILYSFSTFLT